MEYNLKMKSLSTVERICVFAVAAISCFVAGYLSSGSESEYDLQLKIKSLESQIDRLINDKQELEKRCDLLISDLAEPRIAPPVKSAEQDMQKTIDETQKIIPVITPEHPTASNVKITDIGMTVLETYETIDKIRVGFKAKLTNNNTTPVKVSVKFVVKSADGYFLEDVQAERQYLAVNQSEDVSVRYTFNKSIYDRIDTIVTEIELH
jgi:cell division protein FtsL